MTICSRCSCANALDAKFCMNCGQPLSTAQASEPSDGRATSLAAEPLAQPLQRGKSVPGAESRASAPQFEPKDAASFIAERQTISPGKKALGWIVGLLLLVVVSQLLSLICMKIAHVIGLGVGGLWLSGLVSGYLGAGLAGIVAQKVNPELNGDAYLVISSIVLIILGVIWGIASHDLMVWIGQGVLVVTGIIGAKNAVGGS
jgi:hypothetical protein